MTGAQIAAAELEHVLADPRVRSRWPRGFTTDELLFELNALGRVRIAVRDGVCDRHGHPVPEYAVVVVLRDESDGSAMGHGRTLTAAAMRCFLHAEQDLRDEVRRGLASLDDLLATDNP